MVRLNSLKKVADKAKDQVEKRGGTDALKEDANELKSIAKGKGSLKDKAKAAGKAIKDPGAEGKGAEGSETPKQ
jgi:hypothetical protein